VSVRLEPGDCLEILPMLADIGPLFDACITDPPYHLTSTVKRFGGESAAPAKAGVYGRSSAGFMGKTWDGGDIAFDPATWRAVYDTLKPGAYLLAFGGTRTFHRMAVAIEDSGFEIRDTIMWLYGTGFPKSHDVSKGIDKALGAKGTFGAPKSAAHAGWIDRGRMRGENGNAGWQRPCMDDPEQVANAARVYEQATPEAAEWSGWGTALKPAWEPIIVARKPLVGTIAANVLAHGTGALNIDASRVTLPDGDALHDGVKHSGAALDTRDGESWGFKAVDRAPGLGRWPANVIHDGSDEVLGAFPHAPGQQGFVGAKHGKRDSVNTYGDYGPRPDTHPRGDSGTAARFYYSAKATAADRAFGKHPTVKPIALLRYLARLVTRPGGCILDPFAGSGTLLQAAHECGFSAVGIERDPTYQTDILRRLAMLADPEMAAMLA
jgi:site-specific DNA-methyltransferase (adenine-specific)